MLVKYIYLNRYLFVLKFKLCYSQQTSTKMKKLVSPLLLLLVALMTLNGQTTFEKIYSSSVREWANSVIETSDGGFAIIGYTENTRSGVGDVYLVKTNNSGDTIWTGTYGWESDEEGYAIVEADDGGFVIMASTNKDDEFNHQLMVIKTNSTGVTQWINFYDGLTPYEGDVQNTLDGGFIFIGPTKQVNDTSKIYIMKLDSSGKMLWVNYYGDTENAYVGSAKQTTDNGFIFCGTKTRRTYFEGNSYKTNLYLWLIKIDALGDTLWTHEYNDVDIIGKDVIQTNDGGFITTGVEMLNYDMFLSKYDSEGNFLWCNIFPGEEIDIAYIVSEYNEGGYLIAGTSYGYTVAEDGVILLKTDAEGNEIWQRIYRSDNYSTKILAGQQTSDQGFILAGFKSSGSLNSRMYLMKSASDGCLVPFPILYGDSVLCEEDQIELDAGNTFSGFNYFWSDSSTAQKKEINHGGLYSVTVTDLSGCSKSDTIIINEVLMNADILPFDTTLGANESIVLKAESKYKSVLWSNGCTVDSILVNEENFGAGESVITLTVIDQYGCVSSDTICITITASSVVNSSGIQSVVSVYPNPGTSFINIRILGSISHYQLAIFDIKGNEVFIRENCQGEEVVDISKYLYGYYFVRLQTDGFSKTIKFLKK